MDKNERSIQPRSDSMNDEKESASWSQRISLAIAFLIVLLLTYILSIGPVALCCQKMHGDTMAIRQFYLPVIWLHENTVLKRPLEMYIELWGVH
jgi:hypothetical protein